MQSQPQGACLLVQVVLGIYSYLVFVFIYLVGNHNQTHPRTGSLGICSYLVSVRIGNHNQTHPQVRGGGGYFLVCSYHMYQDASRIHDILYKHPTKEAYYSYDMGQTSFRGLTLTTDVTPGIYIPGIYCFAETYIYEYSYTIYAACWLLDLLLPGIYVVTSYDPPPPRPPFPEKGTPPAYRRNNNSTNLPACLLLKRLQWHIYNNRQQYS